MSFVEPNKQQEFYELLRENLPFKSDDESILVLKAHLIAEELLNEYIQEMVPNPKYILGVDARTHFGEKMKFSQCISPTGRDDRWIWQGLRNLNQLRNAFAHSLKPDQAVLDKAKKKFIKQIKDNNFREFKSYNLADLGNGILSLLMAAFVVFELIKNRGKIEFEDDAEDM